MTLSDLLTLPYDRNTNIIDIAAIMETLPHTPEPVARQVYSDHGRNHDFQSLYGELNIQDIRWSLNLLPARELIACSLNHEFRRWFTSSSERASKVHEQGWPCIDVRQDVQSHWAKFGTWMVEPVFINGQLVGRPTKFHLIEGHTRVGLLKGLTERGIVGAESMHRAWVGNSCPSNR